MLACHYARLPENLPEQTATEMHMWLTETVLLQWPESQHICRGFHDLRRDTAVSKYTPVHTSPAGNHSHICTSHRRPPWRGLTLTLMTTHTMHARGNASPGPRSVKPPQRRPPVHGCQRGFAVLQRFAALASWSLRNCMEHTLTHQHSLLAHNPSAHQSSRCILRKLPQQHPGHQLHEHQ